MTVKRKLKVYGGELIKRGKQIRVVVAAFNMKEVAGVAGLSQYEIRYWWCETWNTSEIEKAVEKPHTLVEIGQI